MIVVITVTKLSVLFSSRKLCQRKGLMSITVDISHAYYLLKALRESRGKIFSVAGLSI